MHGLGWKETSSLGIDKMSKYQRSKAKEDSNSEKLPKADTAL